MKFLENSKLELLSNSLSTDSGDLRLDFRLESYSCKLVKSDKRQLTDRFGPGASPHDLQPLSPPAVDLLGGPNFPTSQSKMRRISGGSDTGDEEKLCDSINGKMLFNLTALLNSSFPDYDFSQSKASAFSLLPDLASVMRVVETHLGPVSDSYGRLKSQLWSVIDEEIQLNQCLLYSYNPGYLSDPFSEDGCLWSFNFFFYNRTLKRILFLNCRASSGIQDSTEGMSDDIQWDIDE